MASSVETDSPDEVDFCTLGMFIIDEIHFQPPDPRPSRYNVPGGAGTYSALGARIYSPGELSKKVGWTIDCGSDFEPGLRESLSHWRTNCVFRETLERQTTRGWNYYGQNEHRGFKYLTPKLRLDAQNLPPQFLSSRSFHLICSPSRCSDLATNINSRRPPNFDISFYIWEPVPDVCTPVELAAARDALLAVDVVSPNHVELAMWFGDEVVSKHSSSVDEDTVEKTAREFIKQGIGSRGDGAIVVRAGEKGCFVLTQAMLANEEKGIWFPAYHPSPEDKRNGLNKVVDPTGGGNGFLGGLSVGLARGKAIEEAAIMGTISASFAIEQVGIPSLVYEHDGETWNGVRVEEREQEYTLRIGCNTEHLV
ncbi:Ribokinase-like protein [Aulographum hederae CBS 113979]|uniref:Ribokinase-like protein n=1 Tax=Aulographum hederae CBS 113979 TaxID=1176131 RepID=A0A6G1HH67_9PEZI|nr:Ribokinase-like protein [Aulographum hederae CBS 113979]